MRKWKCPKCGENHDRDINAAKNIHRQGLAITNVEMETLDNVRKNTIEITVCETFKKKSYSRLKPLGLAQR